MYEFMLLAFGFKKLYSNFSFLLLFITVLVMEKYLLPKQLSVAKFHKLLVSGVVL